MKTSTWIIRITIDRRSLKLTKHKQRVRYLKIVSSWKCALVGKRSASRFESKAIAEFVSDHFWEIMSRDPGARNEAFGYLDHIDQDDRVSWSRQVIEVVRKNERELRDANV